MPPMAFLEASEVFKAIFLYVGIKQHLLVIFETYHNNPIVNKLQMFSCLLVVLSKAKYLVTYGLVNSSNLLYSSKIDQKEQPLASNNCFQDNLALYTLAQTVEMIFFLK